jgi:hypothetical protein
MHTIELITDFLKSAILLTFGQIAGFFGILFFFGLILYFLARNTRRVYAKSTGPWLDIVVTGWIGTPVHEIGHALFCLIFFHRIEKIKLFDPNPREGTMGYVVHSYNKKNLWQRIGNFFIGVGPVVFGALVLWLLMYLLLPEMKLLLKAIEKQAAIINALELSNWQVALSPLLESAKLTLNALSKPENFSRWQFWLFVYYSLSIASHMELSLPDLKSALSGFLNLVLLIFLVNLTIALLEVAGAGKLSGESWKYFQLQTYAGKIAGISGIATGIFIYATIISTINFTLSWLLLSLYTLVRYRRGINPFWG